MWVLQFYMAFGGLYLSFYRGYCTDKPWQTTACGIQRWWVKINETQPWSCMFLHFFLHVLTIFWYFLRVILIWPADLELEAGAEPADLPGAEGSVQSPANLSNSSSIVSWSGLEDSHGIMKRSNTDSWWWLLVSSYSSTNFWRVDFQFLDVSWIFLVWIHVNTLVAEEPLPLANAPANVQYPANIRVVGVWDGPRAF